MLQIQMPDDDRFRTSGLGHGGVLDLAKAAAAIIPQPGISRFLPEGFFRV